MLTVSDPQSVLIAFGAIAVIVVALSAVACATVAETPTMIGIDPKAALIVVAFFAAVAFVVTPSALNAKALATPKRTSQDPHKCRYISRTMRRSLFTSTAVFLTGTCPLGRHSSGRLHGYLERGLILLRHQRPSRRNHARWVT